jgi:hypothetical protein
LHGHGGTGITKERNWMAMMVEDTAWLYEWRIRGRESLFLHLRAMFLLGMQYYAT